MKRATLIPALVFALAAGLAAQRVVDRIVARINGDIITLGEVRELGAFQRLAGGTPAGDKELLEHLIAQWLIQAEAAAARFPAPTEAELANALRELEKPFPSTEAYHARLREAGLTPAAVERLVARQLLFSRYLDYRFRPATRVEAEEIGKYYAEELVPQLQRRGERVPPRESVEEQIRELLTQREISERANRWLEESRARLKVEILWTGGAP